MATYYAWSNFPVERNEWGQTTKTLKAGDKVTQADLKVSDEDWEELINLGAVREDKYPDVGPNESPAEYAAAHPEEAEEAPAPAPPAAPAAPAQQPQPPK